MGGLPTSPTRPMRMAWEITDDEARASFEVVRIEDLPPINRADIQTVPSDHGACGCYWCQADWRAIAAASVTIFEEGIDPLDNAAIDERGIALGLGRDECGWLLSLFSPTNAIVVLRESKQFTNGMHRTHALRAAGAERCVVYTGRGEIPYDE
jgi:hypothetical protein